jgi:hypothetical protein
MNSAKELNKALLGASLFLWVIALALATSRLR